MNTAAINPLFVVAGVVGTIGLLLFSLGTDVRKILGRWGAGYQVRMDKAALSIKAEDFILLMFGAGALLWVALAVWLHAQLLVGILLLPVAFVSTIFLTNLVLNLMGGRRINRLVDQLELVLRQLAGALRVGLGLRQAVILVTEEVGDPMRGELLRVIGRTNIGIAIIDALDEMAKRVPAHETLMLARSIRVQAQTGGDLAKVLETLANTIKERRRVNRKMKALTAQGRASGYIIGALPLLVGGFVVLTQPSMRDALLHTTPGWISLGIVFGLEAAAILTIMRILRFDV